MHQLNHADGNRGSDTSSLADDDSQFLADVLKGLQCEPKQLPCKYLYDERGSQLFDRICDLEEYYPTRTETQIMLDNADSIAACIGSQAVIVEYGSGSSAKTRVLLNHLDRPRAYLPVDISEDHLLSTARQLQTEYRELQVTPIVADFTSAFELPAEFSGEPLCVYFPGSTIGNLEGPAAVELLRSIGWQIGSEGSMLIGFDMQKASSVLELAYDDPHGVTAQFSLNILQRMNRELDATFDVDRFEHVSFYNESEGRIEIYIESCVAQTVTVAGESFHFAEGERTHTEYSHKYTVEGFAEMAASAGLRPNRVWTDARNYFAIMHLEVE